MKQNYTIVAYYTIDTPYEPLAHALEKNLDSLNLKYYIQGIKNLGSWALNDFYRPIFLQEMLKKFDRIVSLDVDCTVHKPLDFCNSLKCNVAMRKLNSAPVLGTIFLQGTQAAGIMKLWEEACLIQTSKKYCSQVALRKVLTEYKFYVESLPDTYAVLEQDESIPKDAVVIHDYASRRLKCQI